jgi:hypothetical protein
MEGQSEVREKVPMQNRVSKRWDIVGASIFFTIFVSAMYLKHLSDQGQLTLGRAVLSIIVVSLASVGFGYAFWALYARKHRI